MSQLSIATKYRICQLGTWICVFVGVFCAFGLLPWPRSIATRFAFLLVDVVVGIAFGLGYHFFGAQLKNVETGRTEVETLANSAKFLQNSVGTKDDPSKKP